MNKLCSLVALAFLLVSATTGYAQRQYPFSFDSLFARYPSSFDSIIRHKEDYRLQILYTRIDRDAGNRPHLTTYSVDADRYYYYCASMMKLPACALTLEKLNNLSQYHVSMFDSLGIDTIPCTDLGSEALMLGSLYSRPSQYIKEMLLVSNNNAFNPIYDFLGQYDFQQRLHQLGYPSAIISNRYAGCDTAQNRRCDPVSLFDIKTHQLKYTQPCIVNQRRQFYEGELSPLVGNAYLGGGAIINQPKSFRFSNYIKLSEVHSLLTKIIFPQTQNPSEKLNLTRSDYQYLYKCMGMFPRECAYPTFDSVSYPDNYMKYFIGLDSGTYTMPTNLRVFNKVGQAYGFMTDCSYVLDTLNKVEFFLSCSMYLNADGILNDGKYEYEQVGFPFFRNLFNAVYSEELTRKKEFTAKLELPDFSDTLLFKVKPAWLKVDTTKSIEEMEAVLCGLADTMWAHIYQRDNLATQDIFRRNFEIVFRQPVAAFYSFDSLQKRNLRLASEETDSAVVKLMYWREDELGAAIDQESYLMFFDHHRLWTRRLSDFPENRVWLSPNSVNKVIGAPHLCYVISQRFGAGSKSGYLQAYTLKNGIIEKAPVFKIKGQLVSDVALESAHDSKTGFRAGHKGAISFVLKSEAGKKPAKKRVRLKFNGTIFK